MEDDDDDVHTVSLDGLLDSKDAFWHLAMSRNSLRKV